MKKIEAIVRHYKMDEVRLALTERGIDGMTQSEVRGTGSQPSAVETYRGIPLEAPFVNKVKIEVVVDDEDLDAAVEAVLTAAYTGKHGDGMIWVSDLANVIRIRTGEELADAVMHR
jgi:nitrogen regulatory protein P-II 1